MVSNLRAMRRSTFRSVSSRYSVSAYAVTRRNTTRGYRLESRSTTAETKVAARNGLHPTRTSPTEGSARDAMFFTVWRRSSNTTVPPPSKARPYSVGVTPCRLRSSRWTPRACSRSAIEREMAGCPVFRSAAALLMLPALYDGHENVKVVQFHPTSDAVAQLHGAIHHKAAP